MDFVSYRSFLHLGQTLALIGAGYGLLIFLGWIFAPWMAGFGAPAMASAGGGSAPPRRPGVLRTLSAGSWLLLVACAAGFAVSISALYLRYQEVQHWPAQTMYEVIPLGVTAGYLSTLALYFVLGLHRQRGLARAFGDLFVALILLGGGLTLGYVLQLDPTGKPLPPALQSYWFSTHISAYMVGYFTLMIAALGAWLFFCFRFWRGVLDRANHPLSRLGVAAVAVFAIAPAPFGSQGLLLGPGVLALAGAVSYVSVRSPGRMSWFDNWEKEADRFTWLIFVVGFPFLTAGLMQGALWAQEAWAIYWGWDSKEVSALISWIFYAVYLHLRYLAGWRGEKGMMLLCAGALSIYITFQLFGFLPDSQKSLHRYTDMEFVPAEGMMDPPKAGAIPE
jgi:cytochrome c-type biogenesis protein CcsB